MTLSSPRFNTNDRLATAAENNPPMNWGEVGEAVRLVQQGFIDLGFSMPISTKRFGSPDGIFGDETKAVARAFQSKHGLVSDGIIGRLTLGKLDSLLPKAGAPLSSMPLDTFLTHRFRITFRSGAMPDIPEDVALDNARKAYGQYGFQVDEGPGMSILITPDQQVALDASRTECRLNQEDQLQRILFSLGGGRTQVSSNDILVFYINRLVDTDENELNGCASHRAGEPAVAVSASGSPWTCAHEVGHVLLGNLRPTHSESKANLMFRSTNQITAPIPGLTEVQVRQMRKSPLVSHL